MSRAWRQSYTFRIYAPVLKGELNDLNICVVARSTLFLGRIKLKRQKS